MPKLKIIIEGASGTGKTYLAAQIKKRILNDPFYRKMLGIKTVEFYEGQQHYNQFNNAKLDVVIITQTPNQYAKTN